jgi:hypothetical protein
MIERIVSECASNLMLVLIRLTEPPADIANQIGGWATAVVGQGYGSGSQSKCLSNGWEKP